MEPAERGGVEGEGGGGSGEGGREERGGRGKGRGERAREGEGVEGVGVQKKIFKLEESSFLIEDRATCTVYVRTHPS